VTAVVLAEFACEADFSRAMGEAREKGVRIVDGYAPFLPEAGRDPRDRGPLLVTIALAIAGFAAAGGFYLLEWWTATLAYPFDSGGRPANSWPAFIMAPFEFGVFCAGLFGFLALLALCGLPRPHQGLFAVEGAERLSQDRYGLALEATDAAEALAQRAGALSIRKAEL